MRTLLSEGPVAEAAGDLLVVPVILASVEKSPARAVAALREHPALRPLDDALSGKLVAAARRQSFGPGRELLFQTHGALPSANLLLACVHGARPRAWYELAELTARTMANLRARRSTIALLTESALVNAGRISEGIALARYGFTRFRSLVEVAPPLRLTLIVRKITKELRAVV